MASWHNDSTEGRPAPFEAPHWGLKLKVGDDPLAICPHCGQQRRIWHCPSCGRCTKYVFMYPCRPCVAVLGPIKGHAVVMAAHDALLADGEGGPMTWGRGDDGESALKLSPAAPGARPNLTNNLIRHMAEADGR